MPLIECAAATILSAQPHRHASFHQTAKGQSFGHAVIHRTLPGAHLGALFKQLLDFRMDVKIFRDKSSAAL